MPFSFKPTTSQPETSSSSFSFGGEQDSRTPEKGLSLLDIVIYSIFGVACLLVVVLFGYRYYLNAQIKEAQEEIMAMEDKLSKYPIDEMRKFSTKIKAINDIIKQHPYVTAAFKILEDSIEHKIVYETFSINSAQGKYSVSLQATSPDYKSIVQQVETLKNLPYNNYITDVKVSGLSPTKDGEVLFALELPMSITGTAPEDLNLSMGRASSTSQGIYIDNGTIPVVSSSTTSTSSAPVVQQ